MITLGPPLPKNPRWCSNSPLACHCRCKLGECFATHRVPVYPAFPPTRERLDTIRVLYTSSDTITLWGIPYDLRPGQAPRHIFPCMRGDWIYLGEPGWFGTMSKPDIAAVKEFRDKWKDHIPGNPHEWCILPR